jgi:hypothetical protein
MTIESDFARMTGGDITRHRFEDEALLFLQEEIDECQSKLKLR